MKWKLRRFSTPRDLRRRTTLARLVLWTSGTVATSISALEKKTFEKLTFQLLYVYTTVVLNVSTTIHTVSTVVFNISDLYADWVYIL